MGIGVCAVMLKVVVVEELMFNTGRQNTGRLLDRTENKKTRREFLGNKGEDEKRNLALVLILKV